MELTGDIKDYLRETTKCLAGSDRRLFMARTVRCLGADGQRRAERELGWSRVTIRKGVHELSSGIRCVDAFSARGRKRAEEHLLCSVGGLGWRRCRAGVMAPNVCSSIWILFMASLGWVKSLSQMW